MATYEDRMKVKKATDALIELNKALTDLSAAGIVTTLTARSAGGGFNAEFTKTETIYPPLRTTE